MSTAMAASAVKDARPSSSSSTSSSRTSLRIPRHAAQMTDLSSSPQPTTTSRTPRRRSLGFSSSSAATTTTPSSRASATSRLSPAVSSQIHRHLMLEHFANLDLDMIYGPGDDEDHDDDEDHSDHDDNDKNRPVRRSRRGVGRSYSHDYVESFYADH